MAFPDALGWPRHRRGGVVGGPGASRPQFGFENTGYRNQKQRARLGLRPAIERAPNRTLQQQRVSDLASGQLMARSAEQRARGAY